MYSICFGFGAAANKYMEYDAPDRLLPGVFPEKYILMGHTCFQASGLIICVSFVLSSSERMGEGSDGWICMIEECLKTYTLWDCCCQRPKTFTWRILERPSFSLNLMERKEK